MSFDDLLIHTCDIGTLTQAGGNEYGTPDKTWPVTYPDEPCRMMHIKEVEVKRGAEVCICDKKVFLDINVDIDVQDRISDIQLASTGVVIDSSTFEIIEVIPRSNSVDGHHYEVLCRKVT